MSHEQLIDTIDKNQPGLALEPNKAIYPLLYVVMFENYGKAFANKYMNNFKQEALESKLKVLNVGDVVTRGDFVNHADASNGLKDKVNDGNIYLCLCESLLIATDLLGIVDVETLAYEKVNRNMGNK
ncbi:hypothetical protein ACJMK2_022103 [Sinanodonta woodiana]|uniref:Uncharacterized protein n=1 Tax=Sinanodonta woodiana TaxID=1069815 RepID=A0ABD3TJB3_SINWO